MKINAYSYEKLLENYPPEKFTIIINESTRDGLYTIGTTLSDPFSKKTVLYVYVVNVVR